MASIFLTCHSFMNVVMCSCRPLLQGIFESCKPLHVSVSLVPLTPSGNVVMCSCRPLLQSIFESCKPLYMSVSLVPLTPSVNVVMCTGQDKAPEDSRSEQATLAEGARGALDHFRRQAKREKTGRRKIHEADKRAKQH